MGSRYANVMMSVGKRLLQAGRSDESSRVMVASSNAVVLALRQSCHSFGAGKRLVTSSGCSN